MNFQHLSTPTSGRNDAAASAVGRAKALTELLSGAAEQADATASIAPMTWEAVHRSGIPRAPFAVLDGGEDLLAPERYHDLVGILRLIGAGDLSIGRLLEGHINAVALVRRYGSEAQATALARAVADGALAAVWGADDAAGLRATRVAAGWRLDGRKILASGVGFVTCPIVTAASDHGQIMLMPHLAIGERGDISGWTAQGMRSTATGSVDLSGLELGPERVLGEPGDFMRQPHFSGGAWRFCAVHLGAVERLVDLFREHLVTRSRSGDAYQLQRIAHCVAAVTTAAMWVTDAARRLAECPAATDETVAFVNLTRMVTERAALDVLEAVHRGVGLGGFVRPHPIERITRDLSTYLRQPVPDVAMADAARTVLASSRPTSSLWGSAHEG